VLPTQPKPHELQFGAAIFLETGVRSMLAQVRLDADHIALRDAGLRHSRQSVVAANHVSRWTSPPFVTGELFGVWVAVGIAPGVL
jgi:hypothetical protein